MVSRALPLIYERLWRPLGGRLLMGALGPGMAGERRIALEMLRIAPGDAVLDVACGPGNFTRAFAGAAGDGVVVGLDASRTMLAQAARERPGDAQSPTCGRARPTCPFRDGSFDAVCCFAALYLIEEPLLAVAEIARVLAPGGRVALLSSVAPRAGPAGVTDALVRPLTGVRIFGRDDLTRRAARARPRRRAPPDLRPRPVRLRARRPAVRTRAATAEPASSHGGHVPPHGRAPLRGRRASPRAAGGDDGPGARASTRGSRTTSSTTRSSASTASSSASSASSPPAATCGPSGASTATPDRRLRRRGERLAREHLGELARSERLAAEALRAWVRGPRPHADERLERVCARLDELSARWSALAVGDA